MAIITVSRQVGSRGDEIATALITQLKYDFLDKRLVDERLASSGLTQEAIDRFDERKPGFWDRLSLNTERYKHFLLSAIYETAKAGNCVIVGRGAHVALAGVPGVMRVRVVASVKTRIHRIMRQLECSEDQAQRIIQRSDQNRAGFHRFFFEVRWDAPELYDLTVNTDRTSVSAAAELIALRAQCPPYADAHEVTQRHLGDLFLAQRVKSALLLETNTPLYLLDVEAEQHVVTLSGTVGSAEEVRRCEEVALGVEGVERVINRTVFMPRPTGYL